jgi:AraC-like DNA-binding protein
MPSPTLPEKKRAASRPPSVFLEIASAPRVDGGREIFLVRPLFFFFSRTQLRGPYICAPHRHNEFEVILVVKGAYDCRLNGVTLRVPAHSALVVQPGDWHEDFCDPPLEYVGLRFTLRQHGPGEAPRFFREGLAAAEQWTPFPTAAYLSVLDKITAETAHGDAAAAHIQDALLCELFWRLVRAFEPTRIAGWLLPDQPNERFQTRLRSCFAQNIGQPLTVSAMARSLGISPRTLSQRCRKLFHLSPARAFLHFRLNQAQELLARTEMSVKEVSYRLGFSNPYHFSRVYKQVLGCPPSAEKMR